MNKTAEKLNIFNDKTGITDYDNMMSDKILKNNATVREYYKFEKGTDNFIKYMTADEYMNICSDLVFSGRNSYNGVESDTVDEYSQMILNGNKFSLPYIDIKSGNQEGRHRMLAGAKAFGENKMFPVLVVVPTKTNEKEIKEYAEKAYPDFVDWAINYVHRKLRIYEWG